MMYQIELAKEEDIEAIAKTTQVYYKSFDKDCGFLLGYRTKEGLQGKLDNFYVCKGDRGYLGHVFISFGTPPEYDELDFYDESLKTRIQQEKVIYIEHIATNFEHIGQGVGSALLQFVYESFPQYHLMSSVVVKPYYNEYSLKFHEKNGFKNVAYYKNDVIEDVRYESVYLLKERK